MLKKINRLTKDKDFNNVFKNNNSSYDKIIGVKIVVNKLGYCRFGILVSNKVSKEAVERNRIKRKIREIIQPKLLLFKQGYDCVIITLPQILNKKYQEIEESINKHFKKLRLYKKIDK